MANYTIWALGASQISISGGVALGTTAHGTGAHLVGRTITLNSYAFEQIAVRDAGSDVNFDDNDRNQVLDARQSFDGRIYNANTVVEAEYRIVLRDPATGQTYQALGVNFATTSPAFGTVEGLAFVDRVPPRGVALQVTSSGEGPGSSGQPPIVNVDIAAPPCFTPGTLIDTERGPRPVETLRAGDLVQTLDAGLQPLIWVGRSPYGPGALAARPDARPVRIAAHAFGPGRPARDIHLSPQHRILIDGPLAELCFGEAQVLAAAGHLVDGARVGVAAGVASVTYIHLLCARHEILLAEGLPCESFNPGALSVLAFDADHRRDLDALLPGLALGTGPGLRAARPLVRRHEAALWMRLSAMRGGQGALCGAGVAFPLASARGLC